VLGGVAIAFGVLGIVFDVFRPAQFGSLIPRVWGQAVQNQVLIAVPMFVFMGTILEKSGVADQLLKALQVITRRIPGGLAMSVTLLGTIMAATTGIVGASVIMLTLVALPTMLAAGYSKELSVGTIASAGTLGILIPPSIMLVIMGDLMTISVGTLFTAAIVPGLLMSGVYLVYIGILAAMKPGIAPPLAADAGPQGAIALVRMLFRSFLPPAFLIFVVLGSIFGGWATPTEAGGTGCAGALLLAALNRRLSMKMLSEVIESAALTNALVFFIVFGATLFSFVFRALGGDDLVAELLKAVGIDTGWEILVFVMVLIFVMGFFFDWLEICLIVLPIFAPILAKVDFTPHIAVNRDFMVWFVALVAVNLQSAFLTPPFGFALFYMKSTVPPSVTMMHIYRGIIPFVALQVLALAVCVIWPEVILWLPRRFGFLD
jgi:tripartite ATP-independent transporter DctM subunit